MKCMKKILYIKKGPKSADTAGALFSQVQFLMVQFVR